MNVPVMSLAISFNASCQNETEKWDICLRIIIRVPFVLSLFCFKTKSKKQKNNFDFFVILLFCFKTRTEKQNNRIMLILLFCLKKKQNIVKSTFFYCFVIVLFWKFGGMLGDLQKIDAARQWAVRGNGERHAFSGLSPAQSKSWALIQPSRKKKKKRRCPDHCRTHLQWSWTLSWTGVWGRIGWATHPNTWSKTSRLYSQRGEMNHKNGSKINI